jgi:hypothetical protein
VRLLPGGEEQKETEDRRGARRERERIEAEERNGEGAHLGRKANTRPSRRRTNERASGENAPGEKRRVNWPPE